MKSKASFKSHPLHPILVSFPIAFFTGCLIFDVLGYAQDNESFHTTAMYLQIAGIGFGLLAAIPGIIDYMYTVPPKSSAKKRASQHGLLNTTMIVLFALALYLRREGDTSMMFIMAIEGAGLILLGIAGWLGGTLVYRNQIGVDPRYAHAGKWKEKYFPDNPGQVEVAGSDELKINQMMLLHVGDKRIVLCRSENGYAAFDDRCTHRGASLAGGSMICGTVHCPWHGSQFDVNTGMVKAGPAEEKIATYPVTEQGGKIMLNNPGG